MSSDLRLRQMTIVNGAKAILRTRKFDFVDMTDEADFIDLYGERTTDEGKKLKIIIRIPATDPVGVGILRDFKAFIEKKKYDHAILLALRKYTHYTKKEALSAGIETFSDRFPFFDLFKHEMVPIHDFAPKEEVDVILQKYSIEIQQLPKIRIEDPAVQMLGAQPGNVIKIVRNSATAGKYPIYRFVVA